MLFCAACGDPFVRPGRSKRITCSDSCRVRLGWTNMSDEGRARRRAAFSRAHAASGSGARLNEWKWSQPGARDAAAAANQRRWADPEYSARVAAAISRALSTPEAQAKLSTAARRRWDDPDYAARCLASMRASHRTERYRQLMSELKKRQWKEPEKRARWIAAIRRRSPQHSVFTNMLPRSHQPQGYSMFGTSLRINRNTPWRRLDVLP